MFFCVANGIIALSTRGVYAGALVKKRWYWTKSVSGDLIDWNFADKEVGVVDMLDAAIEEVKPIRIFGFNKPDYVMKIMSLWMTLDELEGVNMKRNYKCRDGESLEFFSKYRPPFEFQFRCRHPVDDNKNRRHSPISLERTWATIFLSDHNFAWYLSVTEVSKALASGHYQNSSKIMSTLDFCRQ